MQDGRWQIAFPFFHVSQACMLARVEFVPDQGRNQVKENQVKLKEFYGAYKNKDSDNRRQGENNGWEESRRIFYKEEGQKPASSCKEAK